MTINFPAATAASHTFTVSELNRQAKRLLEVSFMQVLVQGELSGFNRASSGHWYFTLKDEQAQIRCAMFKGANQKMRYLPANGDQIILQARVTLYESRGDYQLNVEHIEPFGLGARQQAFEQLKAKLLAEGLFDQNRKKTLPRWPRHIGVITSSTGAAIHDILSVTARRFPATRISLYPTVVQGDSAPGELCKALELANHDGRCDVLILGRGGGSMEDLWAFNDEALARAIARSKIPVVSAVGHEVDFTITDLVADVRAPTPSAAAELLTPDQYQLNQRFDEIAATLQGLITRRLDQSQVQCRNLQLRLISPDQHLSRQSKLFQQMSQRLAVAMTNQLNIHRFRLDQCVTRLEANSPTRQLPALHNKMTQLEHRLDHAITMQLERARAKLAEKMHHLDALSPLATLKRGYAIVYANDHLVHRAGEILDTQRLKLRFSNGVTQLNIEKDSVQHSEQAS